MNRIPLWIDLRHVATEERTPFLREARKVQAEHILVPSGDESGTIQVAEDGSLNQGRARLGAIVRLASGEDQNVAAKVPGVVIVDARDWTIIPLENLIAARRDRPGTLFGLAHSPEEAGLFRDTLEVGVHGVCLAPQEAVHIAQAHDILRQKGLPTLSHGEEEVGDMLVSAKVTRIVDAGPGDRVCVDTTSQFTDGEGLLVGSTARGFALIHAETIQTEYVNARPFRVNAGAIHSYLLGPDGKTQYLSEVRAGHRVLAVKHDGTVRTVSVGRAKIEVRPHSLVEWKTKGGAIGNVVVQTAETIRFVSPEGKPISVTALKSGDAILVHTESSARHFGMPVDERLEER